MLAAASLAEVLPKLDPSARASFGGSNQLAQQARQGFPFDVFLSASPRVHAGALRRGHRPQAGRLRDEQPRADRPAPESRPHRQRRAISRERPKLSLVVAGPKVPIGLYTREVLKRLGLLRVLRKTVSLEPDVKGIVGKVALGEADAGFVYATDVRPVAGKVRVIRSRVVPSPPSSTRRRSPPSPRDLEAAQAFLIALLGSDGRRALRAGGFGLPSSDARLRLTFGGNHVPPRPFFLRAWGTSRFPHPSRS